MRKLKKTDRGAKQIRAKICKTKMNLQQHNVNTSIRPKFSISSNHALFPARLF